MIRVNLFLEQNGQSNQLGVRFLKCESDRNEENLIEILSNCIPILKESLRLNTIDELDLELARRFKDRIPIEELNKLVVDDKQKPIIEDLLTGDLIEEINFTNSLTSELVETIEIADKANDQKLQNSKKKNDENKFKKHEHPTLLHLAAEFNLKQFASSLFEFATSKDLCLIKNCHGLNPLQIAKLNGNNEISQLIKQYIEDEDQIDLITNEINQTKDRQTACDLDYVNMSIVKLPSKSEQTSDFTTDSSDQSSIDGVDSVDGLLIANSNRIRVSSRCSNEYDFIEPRKQKIRLGKLIDLDSLITSEENSSEDDKLMLPPKLNKTNQLIHLNAAKRDYEYDIVKKSPIRANLASNNSSIIKNLSNSFSNKPNCKTDLFERFNELRISSASSATSQEVELKKQEQKSIDLQTTNLTESQIELMNIIKAFKMGAYTNDEMEIKFKQWATKYKYKIDQNNQFETDSINRMGKRSVSSSHLLSQDLKLESKDSGFSSRSSTIKTCLSNINLHASSSSKYGKQFSLTEWFHTLTAKLKQKTDKSDVHKSPKFEKKVNLKIIDFPNSLLIIVFIFFCLKRKNVFPHQNQFGVNDYPRQMYVNPYLMTTQKILKN